MQLKLKILASILLATLPLTGNALVMDDSHLVSPLIEMQVAESRLSTTQSGGMSLSQAIDSVKRGGNVERVISAETKVSGGKETHHIKVLTKDGKVRTHRIPGKKRN